MLIAGGLDPRDECARTTEIYDPKTRSAQRGPPLSAGQTSATAIRESDGKVILAGGACKGALFGVEVFDPGTKRWTAGPAPEVPRASAAVVLLADGRDPAPRRARRRPRSAAERRDLERGARLHPRGGDAHAEVEPHRHGPR